MSVRVRIYSEKLVTARTGAIDLLVPFQNFYPFPEDKKRERERCLRNHEGEAVEQMEADE